MVVARIRRRAGSYLPFIVFAVLAVIAGKLGQSFGQILTIFAVLVWAVVGLVFVYMVLFRNVKLTLWSDEAESGELVTAPAEEVSELYVPEAEPVVREVPRQG